MKIGLLADIHGNYEALKAITESDTYREIDFFMVAGDFVGYYFESAKVIDWALTTEHIAVSGNHDQMLFRCAMDPNYLNEITNYYGSGMAQAINTLSPSQISYLHRLPKVCTLNQDGLKILLAHTAPWNSSLYLHLKDISHSHQEIQALQADILVVGHTHVPMDADVGSTRVINPGSVGQPRDGSEGAQWAVLDTLSEDVTFLEEQYERDALLSICDRLHPDIAILTRHLRPSI